MRLKLFAFAVVLVSAVACGQDAATCASDCALIGQPGEQANVQTTNPHSASSYTTSCSPTCESDQATAATNGKAADFQDLLTCVGNAGSFAPECASLACSLTDAFGTPSGCGEPDAGH